jgi:hypothetical protein
MVAATAAAFGIRGVVAAGGLDATGLSAGLDPSWAKTVRGRRRVRTIAGDFIGDSSSIFNA